MGKARQDERFTEEPSTAPARRQDDNVSAAGNFIHRDSVEISDSERGRLKSEMAAMEMTLRFLELDLVTLIERSRDGMRLRNLYMPAQSSASVPLACLRA